MDLQLPLIWQAVIILTGIGASVIAALVLLLRDLKIALGRGE